MSEENVLKTAIANSILSEYDEMYEQADDESDFSKDFEKKMNKLISRRRKPYYIMINTAFKRVAVIIIAFISISAVTILSVDALRDFFKDLFVNIFSDHSHVVANTEPELGESSLTITYPEKIESKYDITYDLSGYEKTVYSDDDISVEIGYVKDDKTIDFSQYAVNQYDVFLNTEDTELEHIDINGHDAMLFMDNNGYYSITWNNGEYIIQLHTNLDKSETVDIAKSVQKVE